MTTVWTIQPKKYSLQENHVRSILYEQQMKRITNHDMVHSMILQWYESAQLPSHACPIALETSERLYNQTGFRLTDAKDPYLADFDRYEPLYQKFYPATNYIRTEKEINFTPLPDLAHDYFGHMPHMFHPQLAWLQREFANLYINGNQNQRMSLYNLARYIIEYGLIKEHGKTKIFWAGILSSATDFDRFYNNQIKLVPANLDTMIHTPRSPHKPHEKIFVFEDFDHILSIIKQCKKKLGY